MDLSQADPFVGSAGSSRGFQKVLEASIVDIHTVQKVYSGATKYCTESVQWRCRRSARAPGADRVLYIWHCTLWIFPRQNHLMVLPDLLEVPEASRSFYR